MQPTVGRIGQSRLGCNPPTPLPPTIPRLHTASSWPGLASPDSANWANWHHSSITSEPAAIAASTSHLYHPTQPLLVAHHHEHILKTKYLNNCIALAGLENFHSLALESYDLLLMKQTCRDAWL